MKKLLLILALYFSMCGAFAQTPTDSYIGLEGEPARLVNDVAFKRDMIIVDGSEKIPAYRVKYFQNSEGYFQKFDDGFRIQFLKRDLIGSRISTFYKVVHSYSPGYANPAMGGGFYGGGYSSSRKVSYYSKDGGPMKKMKTGLLMEDLSDDPLSMEYLKKSRGAGIAQVGMYVAGFSLIGVGMIQSMNAVDDLQPGEQAAMPPVVFVGLGLCLAPWLVNGQKEDNKLEAILQYNRGKGDDD